MRTFFLVFSPPHLTIFHLRWFLYIAYRMASQESFKAKQSLSISLIRPIKTRDLKPNFKYLILNITINHNCGLLQDQCWHFARAIKVLINKTNCDFEDQFSYAKKTQKKNNQNWFYVSKRLAKSSFNDFPIQYFTATLLLLASLLFGQHKRTALMTFLNLITGFLFHTESPLAVVTVNNVKETILAVHIALFNKKRNRKVRLAS